VEKLDLPYSLRESLFTKYKQARSEFEPGTKFRNPEKLIPGILYYHCKFNCLPIDERILLENSEIGKKDFYELKLNVVGIMPKYYTRDRQAFIKTCLMQLKEEYHLDMGFYHDTSRILEKLWDGIKCTTDDVIAGLVGSLVILCSEKYDISVSSICNHLNIQMSTIQSQVKRKVIERFRVLGFTSLVASADILRDVMDKLGLIRIASEELSYEEELLNEVFEDIEKEDNSEVCGEAVAEGETEDSGSNSEILDDMVLITADEVMPNRPRYAIIIRDETKNTPLFITFSTPENDQTKPRPPKKEDIQFEISRFHYPRGPPLSVI
jgi:hypothetical protein